MHFGITEEQMTNCVSLYNNAGHISKVSEEIASENTNNPTIVLRPSTGNPGEYPHKPYIANFTEIIVIELYFCR